MLTDCQLFNEYTSRRLLDELNMFSGVFSNMAFIIVSLMSLGLQIFLVQVGGDFVRTSPLTLNQWLITIGLGALGIPVGIFMRFIPIKEDPNSFFTADAVLCTAGEVEHDEEEGNGRKKYMEIASKDEK